MPSERLQTAFFTQFPPFSIIPNNTVILKPVISAQAGIQTVRFRFFLRFRVTSKPLFSRKRKIKNRNLKSRHSRAGGNLGRKI
ncbi:FIG00848727: hypothetical protein [Neisseria meningitidis serogroup B]|uniref:PilS cassette n=1 Tax=Neisseria meningitidis serogroup B TaxID=491 RepID=A0A0H5DME8_NEIMI|nr:FIG00848727: hypothetical protein [Neisseria meningitidis serogroup B]